jgi:hypothetical protein
MTQCIDLGLIATSSPRAPLTPSEADETKRLSGEVQVTLAPYLQEISDSIQTPSPPSDSEKRDLGAGARTGIEGRRSTSTFLISYESVFIGVYEAEGAVTPRQAFQRVAQELIAARDELDESQVRLYRPVLLRSARPSKATDVVRGTLSLFESG